MNPGKVSNSILSRSVLKLLKSKNERVAKPAIGVDCGIVSLEAQDQEILSSTESGLWPVYHVANNIYACGGTPLAASVCVIMPRNFNEYNLKEEIRSLNAQCETLGMKISGGHTRINDMVKEPVVTVTGIGVTDKAITAKNLRAGQSIVMTKRIGIGGIQKIIDNKQEEILSKYTQELIDKAYGIQEERSVATEAVYARQFGVTAMHDVSEGGVFAALWDMAEAGHVGLEIDFRKIPVRQEMIEICEMFDVNPYKLESSGALLIATDRPDALVRGLQQQGVSATVIGVATDRKDKILYTQEEERFLETPQRDEIYRFL